MTAISFRVPDNGAHVGRDRIGTALINPDPGLSDDVLLTTAAGVAAYLPRYRDGTQRAGDTPLFMPALSEDGRLELFLQAAPPPAIGDRVAGATMQPAPPLAELVFNADGQPRRVPLRAEDQGGGLWKLSAQLAGAPLTALRRVLFDAVPSAVVAVARNAVMAAPLTDAFVTAAWEQPALREGLLASFAGGAIPLHDPASFLALARMAWPGFAQEFMLVDCTYADEVPVPPLQGFVEVPLPWQGRARPYYQDNYRPWRFHYLPDGFRLAVERGGAPSVSLLKFATPDGSLERTVATFRFFATAVLDAARLEDARHHLAALAGREVELVSLQDAGGVASSLVLALPNASGTASQPQPLPSAQIDLARGLRAEVELSMPAFQALWDAIFSGHAEQTLFLGTVEVRPAGRPVQQVPFAGRLEGTAMQDYFERILDQGVDLNWSSRVTVHVPAQVFSPARNPRVLAVSAIFTPEAVATITAPAADRTEPMLQATVEVQRTIRDIVLGRGQAGSLDYLLKVVTPEARLCRRITNRDRDIFILDADLHDCRDTCP